MANDLLFEEIQRKSQLWVILLLVLVNGFGLISLYYQLVLGVPIGNQPMSDTTLIIVNVLILGLSIFVLSLRLETRVRHDGLEVRFFPFSGSFYKWESMEEVYVRDYSPLREYGGWGFRGHTANRALNVAGNKGLQIVFKDQKRLLIGTQNAEELESVLKKHGLWKV